MWDRWCVLFFILPPLVEILTFSTVSVVCGSLQIALPQKVPPLPVLTEGAAIAREGNVINASPQASLQPSPVVPKKRNACSHL